MNDTSDTVFLFDVDNTLLDNDRVIDDLNDYLHREFGPETSNRYWTIFEQLRAEMGYADYLGALQRYRNEVVADTRLLDLSAFLITYPFPDRLYPDAINVVRRLQRFGQTVILSDGDVVFQPWKIRRSGLWDAFGGRVLIYIHKEEMLDAVAERYPSRHYVMVDDKLRILAAMKKQWGDRLTTIFPRQGHYAFDARAIGAFPPADVTVERIGDLLQWEPGAPNVSV